MPTVARFGLVSRWSNTAEAALGPAMPTAQPDHQQSCQMNVRRLCMTIRAQVYPSRFGDLGFTHVIKTPNGCRPVVRLPLHVKLLNREALSPAAIGYVRSALPSAVVITTLPASPLQMIASATAPSTISALSFGVTGKPTHHAQTRLGCRLRL